ncbi:hypothetical protein HY970_03560 [Candidatus Kaiserbacteria bacterium]|nr:hypothetical protein [Candidatus Kaiserbacteria bacterium]
MAARLEGEVEVGTRDAILQAALEGFPTRITIFEGGDTLRGQSWQMLCRNEFEVMWRLKETGFEDGADLAWVIPVSKMPADFDLRDLS